jgi:hypothetical protein
VQYLLTLIRTEKNTYSEAQSLAALLDVQTQINNVGIDRWCERVTDSLDSITAKFK